MDEFNYLDNNIPQETIAYNNLICLIENVPDFIGQWDLIEETWKRLGFIKHDDNEQKIEDYRYINNAFCQFVFSHYDEIKKNIDNLNLENIKNLIIKLCEGQNRPTQAEGWSPRFVVYLTLKNVWLNDIATQVKIMIDSKKRNEE